MSNFKKILMGAAFAASVTMVASAANAAVTLVSFASYQNTLNAGEFLVADFGLPNITEAPYVLSGSGYNIQSGDNGTGAAPAFSAGVDDTTPYLSVKTGGIATISGGPAIHHMSFYIGSLDTYNFITFHTAGGGTQTFSGTTLGIKSGAANGNQTAANTNGRFSFYSSDAITSVDLTSGNLSFEVSNIGAAVPEPATWAMMIIGFGGVGSMLRSTRRKQAAAFA